MARSNWFSVAGLLLLIRLMKNAFTSPAAFFRMLLQDAGPDDTHQAPRQNDAIATMAMPAIRA